MSTKEKQYSGLPFATTIVHVFHHVNADRSFHRNHRILHSKMIVLVELQDPSSKAQHKHEREVSEIDCTKEES